MTEAKGNINQIEYYSRAMKAPPIREAAGTLDGQPSTDDLAGQITAVSNRIRGLLTLIHPALERALGPHLDHPAVADLLTRYPTPAALRTAGRGHVRARLKKHAPRALTRATWVSDRFRGG